MKVDQNILLFFMKLYYLQSTLYNPQIRVYTAHDKYLQDIHCDFFENIDLNPEDI